MKYTYLIQCFNLYKIGCSFNPFLRIKKLKKEVHNPKLLGYTSKYCEYELHRKYKKYRIYGEWFDFPQDVLIKVKKIFGFENRENLESKKDRIYRERIRHKKITKNLYFILRYINKTDLANFLLVSRNTLDNLIENHKWKWHHCNLIITLNNLIQDKDFDKIKTKNLKVFLYKDDKVESYSINISESTYIKDF